MTQKRDIDTPLNQTNEAEWVKADDHFHKSILDASHNELMQNLVQTLRLALERSRQTTIHFIKKHPAPPYREPSEEVLARHKTIMEAICNREGKKARQKMEELLFRVAELLGNLPAPPGATAEKSVEER